MNSSLQKLLEGSLSPRLLKACLFLEKEREDAKFTAWSFANSKVSISSYWADEYVLSKAHFLSRGVQSLHPNFDLASLTKPLFLNLLLRLSFKDQFIDLIKKPLKELCQFQKNSSKTVQKFYQSVSLLCLNDFLSHQSEFIPWFWMGVGSWSQTQGLHYNNTNIFYTQIAKQSKEFQDNLLNFIYSRCRKKDKAGLYSDINYFLLPVLLEQTQLISKISLPNENQKTNIWQQGLNFLNQKLGSYYTHASLNTCSSVPYFPYIQNDSSKNKIVYTKPFGKTHDTNMNMLCDFNLKNGFFSSHAGLFGSVIDVQKSVIALQAYQSALNQDLKNKNRFIYGLDTPSSSLSTAGLSFFEKNKDSVFGHLAYTGCSFWFAIPNKDNSNSISSKESSSWHTLLTNRTASRKHFKNTLCPRIFIVSPTEGADPLILSQQGNHYEILNAADAFELIYKYSHHSVLSWDDSSLRELPDLAETRRHIAHHLWDF